MYLFLVLKSSAIDPNLCIDEVPHVFSTDEVPYR